LSNTIADEDAEIQTFSMEILATLRTLITKLDADKLMALPQLFWTAVACLESINECEFLEAVGMLNEFLDKLDFRAPAVRRLLYDGQPSKWDGAFEGLQPLLYKGLRSSACLDLTLATLDKLVQLPRDPLVGDDSGLFFVLVANLPRFLHAWYRGDDEDGVEDDDDDAKASGSLNPAVARTAETLMAAADDQGLVSVVKVLSGYLAGQYASETEFVGRVVAALREERFLPALDFGMLTMLMGLLTNATRWVKIKTMRILRVVIPEVDMRKPEIASHGSDMISPLLRLLQTEYCMEALEVLDNIMTLSSSAMDKHHLRMSMTRPTTSKAVRKEYERTQSLFGIPEASGWAVPMPARKTDSTRANIHAAFYMCQTDEGGTVGTLQAPMTPEVEFHPDDFPYGYFVGGSSSDRADTMLSDDGRVIDAHGMMMNMGGVAAGGGGGDLFSKLDSLDDFFDDLSSSTTSPPSDGRSSRTVTEFSPDALDAGAQLYDEKILPILRQASAASGNSAATLAFQNGFADTTRPVFTPRDAGVASNTMNPGAFSFGLDKPSSAATPSPLQHRPHGLQHARSVTSPSAPTSSAYHAYLASTTTTTAASAGDLTSEDEADFPEDVFSDGDEDRPGTAASGSGSGGSGSGAAPGAQGSSFFRENVIRPLAEGTRSRMRRMASGRSRDGGSAAFLFQTPPAVPIPQPQPQHQQQQQVEGGAGSVVSPVTGTGPATPASRQ
jgi:hypothetical protein